MIRNIRIAVFLATWLWLSSCNESPYIEFYSFQELSEYNFIRNGWFPDILKDDAFNIQETYDNNNKHLFGKFDFKYRSKYDSIINNYFIVKRDSLLEKIEEINRPLYPKWFIPKEDLYKDKYIVVKHMDFYLIIEKETNRIYYLR